MAQDHSNIMKGRLILIFAALFAASTIQPLLAQDASSQNPLFNSAANGVTSASTPVVSVPAGFESLNEPQITAIDIWYGGTFLTSTLARFTFEQVWLLNPQEVTDKLTGLIDPQQLTIMLQRPLAANSRLLCRSQYEVECGQLDPRDVGLIFDRNIFRASLHIAPELLETRPALQSRYLSPSSARFSAFTENGLQFSGSRGSPLTYNWSNNTQFALAETRVLFRNNWTDEGGFSIDTVGMQRDYQGKSYQLGLIRSNAPNFEFLNTEELLGVSLESSLITRTDLGQSLGSQIVLFFSSRSFVEIYRDNRLITSDYYEIGNQTLDTSSLPNGSYDIEIRIRDINGITSTEERFYSKSGRLAPIDQTLYFFQLGRLVESDSKSVLPTGGENYLRTGFSRRLLSDLGVGLAMASTKQSSLAEISLFKEGRSFNLSSGIAYETNGGLGLSSELRIQGENLGLSMGMRQVLNADKEFQIGEDTTEYNARLSFDFLSGNASLFYRSNERETPLYTLDFLNESNSAEVAQRSRNSRNYGVRWSSNGFSLGNGRLRASTELSNNNGESIFTLSVSYNFENGKSRYSLAPKYSRSTDNNAPNNAADASASADWMFGEDEQHTLGVRASKQETTNLETNFTSSGFNSASNVSTRYDVENRNLDYSGRLGTTLATTGRARAFGGSQSGESAFLIDVSSVEGDTSEYEVMVNGSPRGKLQAGTTLLVPVSPYETYTVGMIARGEQLVNLESTTFENTVYPGNVIALEFVAEVVKVAIGRIVDKNGAPLRNALIRTSYGISVTNEQGFFQIEIGHLSESVQVQYGLEICQAQFKQASGSEMISTLGTIVCK
jgi:hypothetical protein